MSSRGRRVLRGWETRAGLVPETAGDPSRSSGHSAFPASPPDRSVAGLGLTGALLSGGPTDPARTGHKDVQRPAPQQGQGAGGRPGQPVLRAAACLLTLHVT